MEIDLIGMKAVLIAAGKGFRENEKELCLLDSDIGDGDHGISMAKIGRILEEHCSGDKTAVSIAVLLANIGYDVMGRVGGSSGMLWGAYFSGMGEGAEGMDALDLAGMK